MKLMNYRAPIKNDWTGRVDDPSDPDSYRMHQIIQLLNLENLKKIKANTKKTSICLLGFCCDEGVRRNLGRQGAINGPKYIRKEFANLPVTFGSNAEIYDCGDIYCISGKMEEAQEQLKRAIHIILSNNLCPIVLGGGHELAFGHYNGIVGYLDSKVNCNSSLGIINFDAHLDLRPFKDQGSSGTMFSQIAANCEIQNRQFNYMCLGVQTYSNTVSLLKRAESLNIKYVLAKDFTELNFDNISKDIIDFIDKNEHIYVTICSDVFNSAHAPGVSALQPFGMNPEIVLIFLKQILKTKKVISLDIAEVSPRFDHDNRTAKLIAVIIYAIINVLVENKGKNGQIKW